MRDKASGLRGQAQEAMSEGMILLFLLYFKMWISLQDACFGVNAFFFTCLQIFCWFIHSLTHLSIFLFFHLFMHKFINSFIHSFILPKPKKGLIFMPMPPLPLFHHPCQYKQVNLAHTFLLFELTREPTSSNQTIYRSNS